MRGTVVTLMAQYTLFAVTYVIDFGVKENAFIIFQYISNKMQRYTVYLYLETALHVSVDTSTHHQERIQLYLQHLVFVTPLLVSAAIVKEMEPV